ncbi:MAG: sodium:solute symporter, partial [Treponema sp.]|nr:sodium:solute symporter [Treponema sp.]
MGVSWGALAGAFLAPFLYGLFWKKISRASVWFSFAFGVGLTVSNIFFKFFASPINCGAWAMVGGLILVPLVSLVTPKMDGKRLDSIFACYDESVTVTKRVYLKEDEK